MWGLNGLDKVLGLKALDYVKQGRPTFYTSNFFIKSERSRCNCIRNGKYLHQFQRVIQKGFSYAVD